MTGNRPLDWLILGVSLFNTGLVTWLGLTVLLNAARRNWGVWLIGGGLLAGALFFTSHTALLGIGYTIFAPGEDFWWAAGWLPLFFAPLAWYVAVLWYLGLWDGHPTAIHRHRLYLRLIAAGGTLLAGLILFAKPIPSYTQLSHLDLSAGLTLAGVPLLIWLYPPYIVLCVGLALAALRSPIPDFNPMEMRARRRARPWLVGASLTLLLVSLLVSGVMAWVVMIARGGVINMRTIQTVGWLDLIIDSLVGLAILLIGQSIIAHEIFTGYTIPRGGLQRHWRRVIIFSGGMGVLLAGSFVYALHPIYMLLIAAFLAIAFYALLNWQMFQERGGFMARLRPFITSQGLYDRLTSESPASVDAAAPFQALCSDVLDASRAYLVARGPMAALTGDPLVYPPGSEPLAPALANLPLENQGPDALGLPLDETDHGLAWALPLWSDRGLTGVLFLGPRLDGSLYTQEAFEIARSVCERLIDTQASAEMARRLAEIQRAQLAETQITDRRTRRVLHDEILPQLHAALLALPPGTPQENLDQFVQVHRDLSDLLHAMPAPTTPTFAKLGLWAALQQLEAQEFAGAFDQVTWEIDPGAATRLPTLPPLAAEVLFYAAREAIRNAARHGADPDRAFHLAVRGLWADGLQLVIEDNGVGISQPPGPQLNLGGRGIHLHSTMLAILGGALTIDSQPGVFTRVTLFAPVEHFIHTPIS